MITNPRQMGIDGLLKWLKNKHPALIHTESVSILAYKTISFDISTHIYKYISIYGREDNKWLSAFIHFLYYLRMHRIHATFVFDGISPPEKTDERASRKNARMKDSKECDELEAAISHYKKTGEISVLLADTMSTLRNKNKLKEKSLLLQKQNRLDISAIELFIKNKRKTLFEIKKEDIDLLIAVFDVYKIPYLIAPGEAEALVAYLASSNQVDYAFSMDSDCIAYRVPRLINTIDPLTHKCTIIYLNEICDVLGISSEQLTSICALCTNDYNRWSRNISGLGPASAYKFVKTWGTYKTIKEHEKIFKGVTDDGLNYARCIDLFHASYPEHKSGIWKQELDICEINLLAQKYGLPFSEDKINKLWSYAAIIFEDNN